MQPFLKLALTTLLAHLLGDFPLQSSRLRLAKCKSRVGAYFGHGVVHLLVLVLCVGIFTGSVWLTTFRFWMVSMVYVAAHLVIDRTKQGLVNRLGLANSSSVFLADQLVHVGTIAGLAWMVSCPSWMSVKTQFTWTPATGDRVLEAGIVYVAVVFVGGYAIRYLTRNLTADIKKPGETEEQVKNAGMYIGWLERFLVMTAILVQSPSMVGLILTGKSIARFPELKERFAEYFLIGTLLSIGLAVIGGLVLAKLWYGTIVLK
jgi:Protein of unknown function (DUF3307)